MKVLVTGGSGMVGRCLQDIINTNKYDDNEWKFISSADCNLTDHNQVDTFFKTHKFDSVIHLAACVGGLYKNMKDNLNMFHNNIKMNMNVLKACHNNNINTCIVILSSCIFPAQPSKFPMEEYMLHDGKPHESNKGYAYAKRMMQVECEMYNEQYNRNYICLTPVNLYGPFDNYSLTDGHVIPMLIHKFYNNNFEIYGTGIAKRQFLYAPDFAKIILLTLSLKLKDKMIICCNDEEHSINDVITLVCQNFILNNHKFNPIIKFNNNYSDGIIKKTVSNKYFKTIFPKFRFTPLKDGLFCTINWFIENYDDIRK